MIEPLKILDTFAGIGGFSYAAEKLVRGFETTQFVEIDPYCQKILKKQPLKIFLQKIPDDEGGFEALSS